MMLQYGVGAAQRIICPETIPESEMVAPEWAIARGEVQMIGSRISPSKKLTSRNALLSAMHVVGACERIDVVGYARALRITGENVENGFG
jgi:hypothetical protein